MQLGTKFLTFVKLKSWNCSKLKTFLTLRWTWIILKKKMVNSHNLQSPQKILLRLSLSPASASSLFSFKRNILERLKNTSSVKTYLVENVAAFANLQRTSQHQGTAFTLPFTFLNLSFRTQHKTLWKCFLQRKMNPKHARKPKQKKNQWMTNHTSYLSKTPQTCLCKKNARCKFLQI